MCKSLSVCIRRCSRRPKVVDLMALLIWLFVLCPLSANAQFCFGFPENYDPGDNPRSVCVADFDGDGDRDLAVANFNSQNVSVLKNTGLGVYTFDQIYLAGSLPASVFAADLDGDGDQDLAVGNVSSNNVSILKNNGNGTFASAVNYTASSMANNWGLFVADLDGDGDRDLAVATSEGGGSVNVLKNNGDGTFGSYSTYVADLGTKAVFAADLDGDGDRDLVTANDALNSVSVLKNNSDGTFATRVNYTVETSPRSVFAADLDGDGDQDLAVANGFSNTVTVLRNTGVGSFVVGGNYAAGPGPRWVVASDLDGDGDKDLALANFSSGVTTLLKNNGNGTFAGPSTQAGGTNSWSIVAADLDNDGDQDLATVDEVNNLTILKSCLSGPIVVTNLLNSGGGSLRAAIDLANTRVGTDTITFAVSGVINLQSPLPSIIDSSGGTKILGFTAPGAVAPFAPTVVVDGSLATPGTGLLVESYYNYIDGLTFRNFNGAGVGGTAWVFGNIISRCRFYGNSGPGIDLGNNGITSNDPGDGDEGFNGMLNHPVFDSITESASNTFIVTGTASPYAYVEVFLASEAGNPGYQPESTNHGPAYLLLGSDFADALGRFELPAIIRPEWSQVTATSIDTLGNTSELAANTFLTPNPLTVTAYSEQTPPPAGKLAMPQAGAAIQIIVHSPPNDQGLIDSIGPTFNTLGARGVYESSIDYNSGSIVDARVTIYRPDTGTYTIDYILVGDPGSYLTGIGIDGHAELQHAVSFASGGESVPAVFVLAPPVRGELTGDGMVDVFDVIASIDIVFGGAPAPNPPELVDVNCDSFPDVFDVIYLIDYSFSGGAEPCQ